MRGRKMTSIEHRENVNSIGFIVFCCMCTCIDDRYLTLIHYFTLPLLYYYKLFIDTHRTFPVVSLP